MNVLYVGIHDLTYPRNRSIRAFLNRRGFGVTTVEIGRGRSYLVRAAHLLRASLRKAKGSGKIDVVLLAEFSPQFAPVAWLLAKILRAKFVHDYFVGLVETNIEDWGSVRSGSVRGFAHACLDQLAARLPDLVICDTDPRADVARKLGASEVLTLPVEPPAWATYAPSSDRGRPSLLFYGNYIPLHGVRTILEAVSGLPVDLKVVGRGPDRDELEGEYGGASTVFIDPVPEADIAAMIADAHIVLGVFGGSSKAGSVIPNKVWQALASGRRVITRQSSAYSSLPPILLQSQLVQVPAADPESLALAVSQLIEGERWRETFPGAEETVREHLAVGWLQLEDRLRDQSSVWTDR